MEALELLCWLEGESVGFSFSFYYTYAVRGGMFYELRAKNVEEDLKRREITSYASLNHHLLVHNLSQGNWNIGA